MSLGLGGVITAVVLALVALPVLVGGVLVILIVANRADPDPTGRRASVVYGYATSFITLFVTLFATFLIVQRLASLIGPHHSALTFSPGLFSSGIVAHSGPRHPVGDAVARGVVVGALLALVAGLVYLVHSRSADRATAGVAVSEPAGRVRSSYLAAVSFVCVAIAATSVVVALYQVFRIIAPGVFDASGSGSRLVAFRVMIPVVYLAVASFVLLRLHVAQLPPESRPAMRGPWQPRPARGPAAPAARSVTPAAQAEAEAVESVEVIKVTPAPSPPAPRPATKATSAGRAPAKKAAAKKAPAKAPAKKAAPAKKQSGPGSRA